MEPLRLYVARMRNPFSVYASYVDTDHWRFRDIVLIDPGTYRYLDGIMTLDNQEYRSIAGNYSTDVVANRSLEFLGDAIAAGKPFFLGVTPIGPHANLDANGFTTPIPAERHENLFPNVKVPRTRNFNPTKVYTHDQKC